MPHFLFEALAGIFGVTRKRRSYGLVVYLVGLTGLTAVAITQTGARGFAVVGMVLFFAGVATEQVRSARSAVWRAARRALTDKTQTPYRDGRGFPPTASTLWKLANAVNLVRRGQYAEASEYVEEVDRELLLAEENRLFDAVRAMISIGLGDTQGAAIQASNALPTTCEDFDQVLGRALVTAAWNNPETLRTLENTWAENGVTTGLRLPMPRLRAIVRVRINESPIEALESWEAKELADEARAVGDESLATDLESHARQIPYR